MKASIGKAFAVFGAVVFLGFSSPCACAQAASKDGVPPRFQNSLDLFDQRRCQEVWDELWKFAQTRDYYALYLLAGSAVAHPFRLTGVADAQTLVKLYLPMLIYATLTTEKNTSPFSLEVIRRELIPGVIALSRDLDRSDSKIVIDCFASTEPQEGCVRLAVERHLIPEYDAYIAAVHSLNESLRIECAIPAGGAIPKEFGVPEKKDR